jgi:nitrogen-specific signal transduction histidine kinase/CheY-like chemotaxis protein
MVSTNQVRAEDGEWLGRVWAVHDVTEERLLSRRLDHAQRMETLGTLAGGVAHDFNNQLTAILGNARLAREGLPTLHALRAPLSDVVRSAERCAELTRGLLAFSRQTPPVVRAVDIEAVLREVESVIRPSLPLDVRLEVKATSGLPPVEADPSQLHRVLTNLVVNARDAVGESGFVRLEADLAAYVESGSRCVEIVVSDSGPGMDASLRERIFDPFFTTKPSGQGTGLGLAIVYGIAESHGATVAVESEPGQGCRFRLIWPAAGENTPREDTPETRDVDVDSATGEWILLAEDEDAVRRLVRRTLERSGYRVVETNDGETALSVFRERADEIALALVDLSMPHRNGADAIAAMREIRPGLPAVLMTGHLERVQAAGALDNVPIVMKPFKTNELEATVRHLLSIDDEKPSST